MYGDEYLAGITSGGDFTAVLEIQTSNRTEQEEASGSISGSDAIGANTGEANFKSFLESISAKYQIRISSLQRGGSDPTPPTTPEELIQKAISFPATVTGEDVYDYLATFQTYDVLERPEGANPIEIKNQQKALEELGLYLLRYQRVVESIEYVLDNPGQFKPFDSAALSAKENELNGVINDLRNRASKCFNEYTECKKPTDLADPVVQLPERLSKNEAGAVEEAKKAAVAAQGHAVACKGHAARVLEIRQTITPGPNGKALADEATLEATNAHAAAQLAQTSADAALVAGDASPAAGEFAALAKSAAEQATSAADLAKTSSEEAYKIGYAPYWIGPSRILAWLKDDGYPWQAANMHFGAPTQTIDNTVRLSISDLATCPMGGAINLEHTCSSPTISGQTATCTFNYDNATMAFSLQKATSPERTTMVWSIKHINENGQLNPLQNRSFDTKLRLVSTSTGLKNDANVTIYCHLQDNPPPKPYIYEGKIVM